jgi:hypothetical protein
MRIHSGERSREQRALRGGDFVVRARSTIARSAQESRFAIGSPRERAVMQFSMLWWVPFCQQG